ncbi:hypothetical protein Rsub_02878 [Raphidocelis subcapitata]|uniref:Uncharacterized protein n=1 Tax=Raphidocelis subcapitata TaxID=307507 RepID=A0A2V0NPY8_9CHLO|nr:hypothetical protein Rsub_02878 [Raphidocelis subcapitata]|eukprot:GBF89708.1 hypothetical protein Rsub_02878 [Raphidocelis subcapitata]
MAGDGASRGATPLRALGCLAMLDEPLLAAPCSTPEVVDGALIDRGLARRLRQPMGLKAEAQAAAAAVRALLALPATPPLPPPPPLPALGRAAVRRALTAAPKADARAAAAPQLEPPVLPRLWDLPELRATQEAAPWLLGFTEVAAQAETAAAAAGAPDCRRRGGRAGRGAYAKPHAGAAAELHVALRCRLASEFYAQDSLCAAARSCGGATSGGRAGRSKQEAAGPAGLAAIVRRAAAAALLLSSARAQTAIAEPGPEAAATVAAPQQVQSPAAPATGGSADEQPSQPQAQLTQAPQPLPKAREVVPPEEPLEEPVPLLSYSGPSLQDHILQQLMARTAARQLPPLPACLAASGGGSGAGSACGSPVSPRQQRRPLHVAAAWAAIEGAHAGSAAHCNGGSMLDRLLAATDPSAPTGQKVQEQGQPQPPGLRDLCVEDLEPFDGGCRGGGAQSAGAEWKELLAACGWLRREPLGHLELYLDWSLLQAPPPPQQHGGAADAAAWLCLAPRAVAASLGAAAGGARRRARRQAGAWLRGCVAAALSGAPSQGKTAALRPPEAAVALPSRLAPPQRGTEAASAGGRGAKRASAAAPANDVAFFMRVQSSRAPSSVPTAEQPPPSHTANAELAVQPSEQCHETQAQQEAKAPAAAAAAAAQQLACAAALPPCSCRCITVPPPDCAAHLLSQLQADRDAILAGLAQAATDPIGTPAAARLAAGALWDAAPAEQLLSQLCARVDARGVAAASGADKRLMQQLVALVLVARAASAALDGGPRAAHLFVRHMMGQLPSVAPLVPRGAAALAAAHARAERRGGEDHPKQRALGELLARLRGELPPGTSFLVVVEGKAAFSLLRPISSAGLQPCQLDPSGALSATPNDGGAAWRAAVGAALGAADCLLAAPRQLLHPAFPLAPFGALIEYSDSSAAGPAGAAPAAVSAEGAAQAAAAEGGSVDRAAAQRYAEVCWHFAGQHYRFVVAHQPEPGAAARSQHGGATADAGPQASMGEKQPPATAAAAAAREGQQQRPAPARPAPAAPAAPVPEQTLARQVAAPPQQTRQQDPGHHQPHPRPEQHQHQHQQPPQPQPQPQPLPQQPPEPLPVVISGSPSSLLRRRRDLYECLLRLERQLPGAALVERPGERADVLLTPGACVCVWSAANLPLGEDGPQQALQLLAHRILQLSFAFGEIHFLLELPAVLRGPAPAAAAAPGVAPAAGPPAAAAAAAAGMAALLRASGELLEVARATGVRVQLHPADGPEGTQALLFGLCRTVLERYWGPPQPGAAACAAPKRPPPLRLADAPTRQEAFLLACPALNPLSAARLLSLGLPLGTVLERTLAGTGPSLAPDLAPQVWPLLAAHWGAQLGACQPQAAAQPPLHQQPQAPQQQHHRPLQPEPSPPVQPSRWQQHAALHGAPAAAPAAQHPELSDADDPAFDYQWRLQQQQEQQQQLQQEQQQEELQLRQQQLRQQQLRQQQHQQGGEQELFEQQWGEAGLPAFDGRDQWPLEGHRRDDQQRKPAGWADEPPAAPAGGGAFSARAAAGFGAGGGDGDSDWRLADDESGGFDPEQLLDDFLTRRGGAVAGGGGGGGAGTPAAVWQRPQLPRGGQPHAAHRAAAGGGATPATLARGKRAAAPWDLHSSRQQGCPAAADPAGGTWFDEFPDGLEGGVLPRAPKRPRPPPAEDLWSGGDGDGDAFGAPGLLPGPPPSALRAHGAGGGWQARPPPPAAVAARRGAALGSGRRGPADEEPLEFCLEAGADPEEGWAFEPAGRPYRGGAGGRGPFATGGVGVGVGGGSDDDAAGFGGGLLEGAEGDEEDGGGGGGFGIGGGSFGFGGLGAGGGAFAGDGGRFGAAQLPTPSAAPSAGRRPAQQAGGGWDGGRSAHAPAGAGGVGVGAGSRLRVPAFMPHRNPTKRLGYELAPDALGTVFGGGGGGRKGGGKRQTRLSWK